jgi:glycosyltransferase involved in cell wall biosynthesis
MTIDSVSSQPRLAFLGTYPPRQCGIATFTRDLCDAVTNSQEAVPPRVFAMTDAAGPREYREQVEFEIRAGVRQDYVRAADRINYSDVQLVCIQHEFGIYGGNDGSHLLAFLARLRKPALATLHTVLGTPTESQRAIILEMAEHCARFVVMSHLAADLLMDSHGIARSQIQIIPHGIPDLPQGEQEGFKARFGVGGRRMMLTFGLLSPNKGIETALRGLPPLIERFPDLVYFVVGKTHPNVRRERGEEYRLMLQQEVERLGLARHVQFRDQFVSDEELAAFLRATDVYVTPYLKEAQSTSGTLSQAMGAGAAIVSTPYWHAQEFLADGRGRMFDFGDSEAFSKAAGSLFGDEEELRSAREASWRFTRLMTWPRIGEAYVELAAEVLTEAMPVRAPSAQLQRPPLPELRLDHILRMTDDTGIIQHATFSVPARRTGYCVDDNARALLVVLHTHNEHPTPETASLITTYLSYLELSQNSHGHFRNFMDYSRQIEPHSGSDDCAGRALWALGTCAQLTRDDGTGMLARRMFERALGLPASFGLRGQAFSILGLAAFLAGEPEHAAARQLVDELAVAIIDRYRVETIDSWHWFEPDLSYDNASVPFALFKAHAITGNNTYLTVAQESLAFLEKICFGDEYLNLVGNEHWHRRGQARSMYDEQPVDAAAFVLAFREAYLATGDGHYLHRMRDSFSWFLGKNRLGLPLYDFATAGCYDALGQHEVNQNQGAESTLSFLISLLAMADVVELQSSERARTASPRRSASVAAGKA